jgi:hypothetical protein
MATAFEHGDIVLAQKNIVIAKHPKATARIKRAIKPK